MTLDPDQARASHQHPSTTRPKGQSTMDDLVAAFFAEGGKVTKCPDGRADAPRTLRRKPTQPIDYSRPVSFVVDHCGREHGRNAEGEWLY
jgi:hypothetical protein